MRASISVSRNPSFTTSSHKASISPPSRPQSLKLPTISPNRVKYLSATCQHVPHHFSKSEAGISVECRTGDVVTIELSESRLINRTTGKEYKLKPIGNAGPVSEAGGIFAYARKTGMIPSQNA